MKKLNFNSIQSLQPPDSWIENALAIPEKESKKPAFITRPRIIAAAASIVLVTAVSVALFLTMGDKSPVEIRPSSTEYVQPPTSFTGDVGSTAASESGQPNTAPTSSTEDKAEQIRRAIESVINPTAQTQSGTSTNPTTSSGTQSSATAQPSSQAPTTAPTQKATVKPTEKATQTATEITIITPTTKPTQAPTQKPTQKPTQGATEVTWEPPTETPWIPSTQPTQPVTEVATEPPTESPEPTLSRVTLSSKVYSRNSTAIYCKITDVADGSVYGDPDLYSDGHLVTVTGTSMNTVSCEYKPGDHGIKLMPGVVYYYTFYDADGRMLSRGSFKNR